MKKFLFISAATLCISFPTFAGDYLTNTNQNAAFLRMIARGASIDIDGVCIVTLQDFLSFRTKDSTCH